MLKPSVEIGIAGEKIRKYVPQRARHLVRDSIFAGKKIDLAIYPYDSSEIVTSAAIEKLFFRLGSNKGFLVVVGWDFTIEARKILEDSGAVVLSDRYFGWTDERWSTIKQR